MKWAGGKRQLLNDIESVININDLAGHRVYEPFVGGGAFFLDLEHDNVLINDINKELINVYLQVRDNPHQLIRILNEHNIHHSHDRRRFLLIRGWLENNCGLSFGRSYKKTCKTFGVNS